MTDATAPGLIPRLRAVSRWLRCRRHFRRRISRMCRMGSRSVAITLLAEPRSVKTAMVKRRPASRPCHPQQAVTEVITMRGIGDHDPWNGRSRCGGMSDHDAVERVITMAWRAQTNKKRMCMRRDGAEDVHRQ